MLVTSTIFFYNNACYPLTHYHTIPTFNTSGKENFWKHCEKRRKCWLAAFSLFLTMFPTLPKTNFNFSVIFILLSAYVYILDQSKISIFVNELTLSQTTNFTLFQTERVCRRQFQIWRRWQKVIQTDRKHCGKRRNCSSRAISPFSHSVFKRLVSQGRQKVSLCGNGLSLYHTNFLIWSLFHLVLWKSSVNLDKVKGGYLDFLYFTEKYINHRNLYEKNNTNHQ